MSEFEAGMMIVVGLVLMFVGYMGLRIAARMEGRVPRSRWLEAPSKAPRPELNVKLLAVGMWKRTLLRLRQ